ncbi:FAD-dependent oxidoreductase [Streptomyces sp. S186]|uniref:FAD-dependent oxidoreductase n=1 Tax=Streptomyces sp. S186 TaxID=3434395 RepID=UPI003F680855
MNRVVVVGAGPAGLSAALRLAAAGCEVTVCEQASVPGGKACSVTSGGYVLDAGPTVLTLPETIAEALACVGEDAADWLELMPVDPAYRAHFADGSRLDVLTDTDAMADQIARVCGAREAEGYRRYVAFLRALYRYECREFIDRNVDSVRQLLSPGLARLVALGAFRSLDAKAASCLRDPRTRRLFTFQALYAGLAPHRARALYAIISYMDAVAGVVHPPRTAHRPPHAGPRPRRGPQRRRSQPTGHQRGDSAR